MMRQLLLYTTQGCHLCERAAAMVAPLLPSDCGPLTLVEISESDELMARYGVHIPVLRFADSKRELGWPFDQSSLLQFLAAEY